MKKEKTVEQLKREVATMGVLGTTLLVVATVVDYKKAGIKGVIATLVSAALGVGTGVAAVKFKHKTKTK